MAHLLHEPADGLGRSTGEDLNELVASLVLRRCLGIVEDCGSQTKTVVTSTLDLR